MNSDKKFVTLNNGAKMPTIGMGTWHHGPKEEIDAALRQEKHLLSIHMIIVTMTRRPESQCLHILLWLMVMIFYTLLNILGQ